MRLSVITDSLTDDDPRVVHNFSPTYVRVLARCVFASTRLRRSCKDLVDVLDEANPKLASSSDEGGLPQTRRVGFARRPSRRRGGSTRSFSELFEPLGGAPWAAADADAWRALSLRPTLFSVPPLSFCCDISLRIPWTTNTLILGLLGLRSERAESVWCCRFVCSI